MADLMKEFFRRDLTDNEEQSLADLLAASPRHSMRFAELARRAYRKTGLPDEGGSGNGPFGPLKPMLPFVWRGLLLMVTIGLTLYLFLETLHLLQAPAASVPVPVIRAAAHKGTVPTTLQTHPGRQPERTAASSLHLPLSSPAAKPSMIQPVAYDPAMRYEGLNIMVEQKKPGLVTVRALDASQREVRLLFVGMLKPGKWDFQWDGKLENGTPAGPGAYSIEVQSNGQAQTREIIIHGEPLAGLKK